MFTTWKLTIASMKMFVRNRQALFFTFFTPLLIIVLFGAIGFDNTPKVNIGVAVQGSVSAPTQAFLNQLQSIPYFKPYYGTLADERAALEKGDRSIVIDLTNNPFVQLVIAAPATGQAGAGSVQPKQLTVYSNTGDTSSGTALSVISQLLDKAALQVSGAPSIVSLNVQQVNAHNLKYLDFLLPGLVALSIMQLGVFSVAFVFVEYKEKGILKRIVATPVKPYQFVVANIITRLIVSLIQAALFIAIGVLFFKVSIIGSYWLIALFVVLGAIMFLGMGFTVSGISKTTDSVPALANLFVFPMMFLGGTFFSVDSMPTWLQYVSKILPLTHFSDALRQIMNNGVPFSALTTDLYWILGWSVILVGLAIYTFKFEDSR